MRINLYLSIYLFLLFFLGVNTAFAQSKKLKKQYETAKLAFQNQKYTEADKLFQAILLSKDKNAGVIFQNTAFYVGLIYLQEKKLNDAQSQFKKFVEKYPSNPAKNEALYHLANTHFQLYQSDSNLDHINNALDYLSKIQDAGFAKDIYEIKGNYLKNLSKNTLKPLAENQKDTLIQKIYLHKWATELENIEDLKKMETFAKNNNLVLPEKRKILGEKLNRNMYRIAMIMPFEHEKIKKRDSSAVAKISFQMYQGMRLAQKEINKDTTGNMPKLEVLGYEINKDQSEKLDNLLKSPEIQQSDVIVGSLYDNFFVKIAQQTQNQKNHVVNPISVQDSILKTDFSYTYYPTQSTMMQKVAEFAHTKIPLKTTIILYDNLPKNQLLANFYKQHCEKLGISILAYEQVKSTEKEKIVEILKQQNSTNIGSVLLVTTAQGLAQELMKQINDKKLDFPVFAPDTWLRFQDLNFEDLEKNKVHFFQHDYANFDSPEAKKFKINYSNFSRKEPTQYAYMGYEMTYFWYNALISMGVKRNLKDDFAKYPIQKGVITPQIDFQNGKQNQSILLLKMDKENKLIVAD